MIGVVCKAKQKRVAEEFFELFKTPWEFYQPGRDYEVLLVTTDEAPRSGSRLLLVYGPEAKSVDASLGVVCGARRASAVLDGEYSLPIYAGLLSFSDASQGTACVTAELKAAGLQLDAQDSTVIRLGYDLFEEVRFLLQTGQPIEYAHFPTLDLHIAMLRKWIVDAGVPLLEVSPVPAGYRFAACLTHDIDFVGIRRHFCDHSMLGFLYRASVGGLRNFVRGRLSFENLVRSWLAIASLPFVYLGWAEDFWEPFEWYLEVEKGLPATYFFIPFKRRAGQKVAGAKASRRATAYDVGDLPRETAKLREAGCELGVHGLDSWHSIESGRDEQNRVTTASGEPAVGIRMHWLLQDQDTPAVLEQAGYAYDSTCGYNETVGYRAGTGQVFRPLNAQTLLELPMHIQDGALFYPQRLDLSEAEAEQRCQNLTENATKFGGVLTLLWHDRSHAAERFWGGFYKNLVQKLCSMNVWFASGSQVVTWFGKRRQVRFEPNSNGVPRLSYEGGTIDPPLNLRLYPASASRHIDIVWDGESSIEGQLSSSMLAAAPTSALSLS